MNKEFRPNKVFINWSQNDASKTMVCVFSLRAMDKPSVSFPFSWKDVENLAVKKDAHAFEVLAPDAIAMAEKKAAFYSSMLDKRQRLPTKWA